MTSNKTAKTTSRTVIKPDGSKSQLYFEPVEWTLIDKAAAAVGKEPMQWCADLIRDAWAIEPGKVSMTRIVRQAAIKANHSQEKAVYPIVGEGVEELTLAIKLYGKHIESAGINPNRLPSWSELDSKSKVEWLDKAHAELTPPAPRPLTFGEALELIKAGKQVTRAGWNAGGQFVYLLPASKLQSAVGYGFGEYIGEPEFVQTIVLHNAQGKLVVGWIPSTGDLFANDWKLA